MDGHGHTISYADYSRKLTIKTLNISSLLHPYIHLHTLHPLHSSLSLYISVMMSNQRPSLRRVLSDTWRIISSNSLHFAALSLLFIIPISLFSIIYTWLLQPSQFSHYGRPLSDSADSQIPSFNKSLILYCLIILIFNLCAVSSITHSIFHSLRGNPLKLTSSLKSILSSFLPLLATKLAYFVIMAAINFAIGICVAFVFGGLILVGAVKIDPSNSKSLMAVGLVMAIPYLAAFLYFGVKWCLAYAVVVLESNYGYAPLERSSSLLAKGASRVAFLLVAMFAILEMVLSGWVWALAARGSGGGCSGGVVAQMVVWAALSTGVGIFGLGATAVLLVHCKELNGEAEELELQSDEKKLYVQVPHVEV